MCFYRQLTHEWHSFCFNTFSSWKLNSLAWVVFHPVWWDNYWQQALQIPCIDWWWTVRDTCEKVLVEGVTFHLWRSWHYWPVWSRCLFCPQHILIQGINKQFSWKNCWMIQFSCYLKKMWIAVIVLILDATVPAPWWKTAAHGPWTCHQPTICSEGGLISTLNDIHNWRL